MFNIAMHVSGLPFDGTTIPGGSGLGGSESAGYYMAKELVKLGHKVTLFTSSQKNGSWEGVTYQFHGNQTQTCPMGEIFHSAMNVPYDVVICQRHPMAFYGSYNSKLNIWWLHDLALHRSSQMVMPNLISVDKIITVSEFHKNQVSEVYGVDKEHILASTNGVDYNNFRGLQKGKEHRKPNSLIFYARPERGLENLVKEGGIMEKLHDCHLHVCGYENTTQQMAQYYKMLFQRCDMLPNVTRHGELGKRKLAKLTNKCMAYVYPTNFEDTSCIAAIEANACGTPFIGFENAALPETIGNDGSVLLPLRDGEVYIDAFCDAIKNVVAGGEAWKILNKKAVAKKQGWATAAAQWSEFFEDALKKKSRASTRALYKHLEQMSDIEAIDKDFFDALGCQRGSLGFGLGSDNSAECLPENYQENYTFKHKGTFKEHYDAYYEYEKARGVNYGKENLKGNPRFMEILETIADRMKTDKKWSGKTFRILDYGCAHGHYVMNLAAAIGNISIHGVDINGRNISIANEWADSEEALRHAVSFQEGTHVDDIGNNYDLIIAAEVLEHVPDPQDVVSGLMKKLKKNGMMLISTPYGPWEAMGYKEHKGWRAHIHHFERQDLHEVFGGQEKYNLVGLPHGRDIGHFVLTFIPSGEPLGAIDYDRKLNQQAPQQTLSVCMIAKDAELEIGKTLNSIKDIADEIIVAVDNTTTDDTKKVCEKFGAKIIDIDSPFNFNGNYGFDRARNASIKEAAMQWILWIDSDETLERSENLGKYLRENPYDGYSLLQHHFAIEPPSLLRTDMPVRLFRNKPGVRFFGRVHEHPEKVFNEGIGKVILIEDLAITHTGYASEAIRQKRFHRNLPLMKKDHEDYPDRGLGKFLWLRDLVHMNRYAIQTGMSHDTEIKTRAEEALEYWRKLVDAGEHRYAVEGMQYYSEAVANLGIKDAFQLGFNMRSADVHSPRLNGDFPAPPVNGLFASKEDAHALMKLCTEEHIKIFSERYF